MTQPRLPRAPAISASQRDYIIDLFRKGRTVDEVHALVPTIKPSMLESMRGVAWRR